MGLKYPTLWEGVFTQTVQNRLILQSRGSDIPDEVLDGDLDVGFCGSDVFTEGQLSGRYAPLGFIGLFGAGCDMVLETTNGSIDQKKPLRVVTKYPLTAQYYLARRGIGVASVTQRGGKMEGKLATGKYDAVVDIVETGNTMRDNGLAVAELFDTVQTGIVFRKQAYDRADLVIEPWKIYAEAQTLKDRQNQALAGIQPDDRRKSTLQLLNDANSRRKNLGEECAELVSADSLGQGVLGEGADVSFAAKIIALANGYSPIRLLNEELARNTKPTLWLPD